MARRLLIGSGRALATGPIVLLTVLTLVTTVYSQNDNNPVQAQKPGATAQSASSEPVPSTAPTAAPSTPRITVDQSSRITFLPTQLRLDAELSYEIRDLPVKKLKIAVPKNLEIDSVGADSLEDYHIDEAGKALTVNFKHDQLGAVGISISARRYFEPNDFKELEPLPLFKPDGVERESGQIAIFAAPGLDVHIDEQNRLGVLSAANDTIKPPYGGTNPISTWMYKRQPLGLSATLVRKAPRANAASSTTWNVRRKQIEVKTHLDLDIANIALDTFRIAVPANATDTQISTAPGSQAPAVREVVRDNSPDGDYVACTVTTERPVTDRLPLEISYAISIPADANGKFSGKVAVPRVDGYIVEDEEGKQKTVPFDQVRGELFVKAEPGLVVTVDPAQGGAEPVDVSRTAEANQDALLDYRWTAQPAAFQVATTGTATSQGGQAVVQKAEIDLAVGSGDHVECQWRGRIVTGQRQRLRIDLPVGAEVLAAYVDANPTVVVKTESQATEDGWNQFEVNVAHEKPYAKPFVLMLHFRFPTPPRTFASAGGDLHLWMPRFDNTGELPIRYRLNAAIWVPSRYVLFGQPHHDSTRFARQGWQDSGAGGAGNIVNSEAAEFDNMVVSPFVFPAGGHVYAYQNMGSVEPLRVRWWDMTFYTRIISGALLIVALILCTTSWRNRLTALALAALAFLLFAFESPTEAWYGLVAARFGLVGIAAIWLFDAIRRERLRSKPKENVRSPVAPSVSTPTAATVIASPPSTSSIGPTGSHYETLSATMMADPPSDET